MLISSLDDFAKLLDLCLEKGVESVCVDGISVKFDETAGVQHLRKKQAVETPAPSLTVAGLPIGISATTGKPVPMIDGRPVDEKTLFWSSG